jgi:hypothetical protein
MGLAISTQANDRDLCGRGRPESHARDCPRTMPKLSAGFIWPDLTSQLIAGAHGMDAVVGRSTRRTSGRASPHPVRRRHGQEDNGSRIHCGLRRSVWEANHNLPRLFSAGYSRCSSFDLGALPKSVYFYSLILKSVYFLNSL